MMLLDIKKKAALPNISTIINNCNFNRGKLYDIIFTKKLLCVYNVMYKLMRFSNSVKTGHATIMKM